MLKGPYTAIFISVIVHVLLLLALIFGSVKTPKVIKKERKIPTSIKSFLYVAPKKTPAVKSEKSNNSNTPPNTIYKNKPQPAQAAKTEQTKNPLKTPTELLKPIALVEKIDIKVIDKNEGKSQKVIAKTDKASTKASIKSTKKPNISSFDRLSSLRQKISNQQRDEAFSELTQSRTASMMDAEPFPVPNSVIPLTKEQKYKKNTSTSHVGSITKNDNGTCTIYREQVLGSPVPATTSSFACGESNFDKSFREHMKKVQDKILAR